MKKLLMFSAALLASMALYVGVFSVVLRPLTTGEVKLFLDYKLDYAHTLTLPKVIIFAGSNGRYSHRCEVFTAELGRPCVNASIGVGIALDYLLDQYESIMQPGDLVYLPFEFNQYELSKEVMHAGIENQVMVGYQRDYLWSLPIQRILRAYGSFDLSFLINGLIETGLSAKGFQRRTGLANLTPQGDQKDHTAAIAETYQAFLQALPQRKIQIPENAYAQEILAGFLRRAKQRGITVVGGLPTVPDQTILPPEDLRRLHRIYESNGQHFLELPNQSHYALSCFFDTLYHLNEDCQAAHSRMLAQQMRQYIP